MTRCPRQHGEAGGEILTEPGLVGIEPAHNVILPLPGRQLDRERVGVTLLQPRRGPAGELLGGQRGAASDLPDHPVKHRPVRRALRSAQRG